MELYFWAFIVALLLFSLGAGFSIHEGIVKISDPRQISSPGVNYLVLSVALVIELTAWKIAFGEFRQKSRGQRFFAAVRRSKDPAVFTVLFEDTAAVAGLLVAFIAIALGEWLEMPIIDGVGSIVIGGILGTTAVFLLIECKALLIGEAADETTTREISRIVNAFPQVHRINELRTMHLGPEDVLLVMSVDFRNDLAAGDVEKTVSRQEAAIKSAFPEIKRVFIEIQGPDPATPGSPDMPAR